MTTIERLRALLAGATPGPWNTQCTIDRDPEEYSAECVRLTYEHADSIGEPRQTQLHMVYSGDWDNESESGGIITAMTGNGPTSERNAALIATARNALPALLDVAEAARALAAVHEALHRRGDPEWEGWECDERNALCPALARLDGAEVGA